LVFISCKVISSEAIRPTAKYSIGWSIWHDQSSTWNLWIALYKYSNTVFRSPMEACTLGRTDGATREIISWSDS